MWPNPQFSVDLVTFTKNIFNGKHHFLCSNIVDTETRFDKYGVISGPYFPVLGLIYGVNISGRWDWITSAIKLPFKALLTYFT